MGLFGKKNKEEATTCSCGGNCDTESKAQAEDQEIVKSEERRCRHSIR